MKLKLLLLSFIFLLALPLAFSQLGATDFPGTNSNLYDRAGLLNSVDTRVGIFSAWVRIDGGTGVAKKLITMDGDTLDFEKRADDTFQFKMFNPAVSVVLSIKTEGAYTATNCSGWCHLLVSWDLTSNSTHIYINDTEVIDRSASIIVDDDIDYTQGQINIGGQTADTAVWDGCMTEVYFNTDEFLNFSIESNRRLFISSDLRSVDLGTDGDTPTGNIPSLYVTGNSTSITNFTINNGKGGNFTQNGVLADCSNEPPSVSAADTTLPTITSLVPANNSISNQNPLEINFTSTDDTSPTIFCTLFNGTINVSSINASSGSQYNFTFNSTGFEETIEFLINCTDESQNSVQSVLFVSIDTVEPFITPLSPINNSFHNADVQINLTCEDVNLTSANYTIFNTSDIIQTGLNASPIGGIATITDTLTVIGIADGVYNIRYFCNNIVNFDEEFFEITIDRFIGNGTVIIANDTPTRSDIIQINATCTDDVGLTSISVANNVSGVLTNISTSTINGLTVLHIENHTVEFDFITHTFTCEDQINSIQFSVSYDGQQIPAVLAGLALPLSNPVQIVGMFALLVIIIGTIFGKNFGNRK